MTLTLNPSTSIRPLGEEHLRMFRRVAGSAQPDPLKVTLPQGANEVNMAIKRLIGAYASIVDLQGKAFGVFPDTEAKEKLGEFSFTAEDVKEMCRLVGNTDACRFDSGFRYPVLVAFVIQAINKSFEDNDSVVLEFIDGNKLDMFGVGLRAGTLVIRGDIGDEVGWNMLGGKLIIEGNTGRRPGARLYGNGILIINGKAGAEVGWDSTGGKIYINGGDAPDISPDCQAEVYYKGVKVWPK